MKETMERLKSTHLQNERSIWVREPNSSSTAKNLTVFLDGELYRERVGAVPIIDDLFAQSRIADSWFVFVSMESAEARWKECPCHPPFAKFIAEELLPWLERRHPDIRSVRQKIVVGLSYTGLAAAFMVKTCPGLFQKVICQSGSFWWNDCWFIKECQSSSARASTDYYLDVGKAEIQEHVHHRVDVLQVVSQLDAVRRFREVLLQRGDSVAYVEFDGGHDCEAWKLTLPGALAWALPITFPPPSPASCHP